MTPYSPSRKGPGYENQMESDVEWFGIFLYVISSPSAHAVWILTCRLLGEIKDLYIN